MYPIPSSGNVTKIGKLAILSAATLGLASTASAQLHPTGLRFNPLDKTLQVAPMILKGTLPTSVDLSAQFPPPGDQGNLGSCVSWAVGYALLSQQIGVQLGWGSTGITGHQFSPAWIYKHTHYDNSSDGGGSYFSTTFNLLRDSGGTTLAEVPYSGALYAYTAALPAYASKDAAHYRGGSWSMIPSNNVTQVKTYLSAGKAVVIGIDVYPDFDNISAANPIYDVQIGTSRGGHAITLVGYDDAKQAFKFLNSWSTGWGLGGYGWISYGLVQKYYTYVMTGSPVIGSEPVNYSYSTQGVGADNPLYAYDLLRTTDRILPFNLDGSGKKSLIVYRAGLDKLSIFKSLGENGYQSVYTQSESGINGYQDPINLIIPCDFNGDGKGDLILANPGLGYSGIFQGNGDGTFKTIKIDYAGIAGFDFKNSADQILVTDYDGDGKDDLVLYRPGTGVIRIAHSNGNGTFTSVFASTTGINGFNLRNSVDKIVSLDFNGDKKKDLMLYRSGPKSVGGGAVSMLQSLGNGTYTTVFHSDTTGIAGYDFQGGDRVLVGDVNGDKFDDLILYRPGTGKAWVVKSNGNGTFVASQSGTVGFGGFGMGMGMDVATVGDVNGDGKADLFMFHPGTGVVWVARGTSAGTFVYHWSNTNGVDHNYQCCFGGIGGFDYSGSDQAVLADQEGSGMSALISYRPGTGLFQTSWFTY